MNQRAVRALPKFVWKEKKFHHWLYYKPDSEAETGKWEWQVKEEEWVTMKEAERIWRERGGKYPLHGAERCRFLLIRV